MQKLVYLFELDSVRKSDAEILIGQQALYDEIVGNGNVVVLTFNQLVDSRGFFSMLDVDGYYDNLIKLFKSDAIRISQFGDVRTISQYLINSLAYERSFIYSGWPLKSTQKRLLALIKRSLMYSDLTELSDYQNGVRTDEEILDLFIEIEAQQPRPTALNVKQCKDIIENLFYLIKTVLRLSSIHTIYVTPKPGDEYKMSLPKYLHHALSLTPADHCDLWQRAKAILLSLKDEYVGVSKRTKPIFDYEHVKGSFDRSDYHHVIKRLYQQATEKDPSADAAPYQYAEAIVDLCYNYQLEYSICNSSKHYSIREFLSDNAANWVSFASDFFQRLKQSWDIGNPGGRFLLDETNVFDEFQPGDDFPDFAQAVRMLGHTEKASEQPETEGVERYEHALDQQKATRKKSFQSTIRKKVLFSLICFAIALALEVSFEFLQNELDGETYIDGIGTQMHISCYEDDGINESKKKHIRQMFQLMAATGKLVRVSELDMGYVRKGSNRGIATADVKPEEHKKMADLYKFVIESYFELVPPEQQYGICQWCLTDAGGQLGTGWRGGEPVGIWTEGYKQRKEAYRGFAEGLSVK